MTSNALKIIRKYAARSIQFNEWWICEKNNLYVHKKDFSCQIIFLAAARWNIGERNWNRQNEILLSVLWAVYDWFVLANFREFSILFKRQCLSWDCRKRKSFLRFCVKFFAELLWMNYAKVQPINLQRDLRNFRSHLVSHRHFNFKIIDKISNGNLFNILPQLTRAVSLDSNKNEGVMLAKLNSIILVKTFINCST